MTNPLLEQAGLPLFSKIKPEHVEPAIDQLLADNRRRIDDLLDNAEQPSWDNLVEPIEELEDHLERVWSPVSHMNAVTNSEELRAAYNACLPKLSDYGTEMGHNERLFLAYKAVAERAKDLDDGQRKVLDNALRDFLLSGVDLAPDVEPFRIGEDLRVMMRPDDIDEHCVARADGAPPNAGFLADEAEQDVRRAVPTQRLHEGRSGERRIVTELLPLIWVRQQRKHGEGGGGRSDVHVSSFVGRSRVMTPQQREPTAVCRMKMW